MSSDPSHHDTAGWLPRVAPYVAPLILVCVASLQIFLAHHAHLSPWKGGGFGMFSTVARPDSRVVRGYLLPDDDTQIPLRLPSDVDRQMQKVRCLPSPFQLERLAHELEALSWVVGRTTPFAVLYEAYRRRYDAEHSDPAPAAVAPPAQPVSLSDPSGKIWVAKAAPTVNARGRQVRGRVAIEVWQLRFNGHANLLQLEPLTALNAEPHE